MCRFIAYFGQPLIIDELLCKPNNSLIHQSIHAKEADMPLNGDGFGLGWYSPSIDMNPAVFTSTQPAWNDLNLKRLAPKIRTNCFFAHVRAATHGRVSMSNCHPFQFKRLLFMHNGGIGGFTQIKRYIRRRLSDPIYDWVQGSTDSEHLFALFLENWLQDNAHYSVEEITKLLKKTIHQVCRLQKQHGIKESSHFNLVVSSGNDVIATRYLSNPSGRRDKARSLYYAEADEIRTIDGVCHLINEKSQHRSIVIASEKLDNHKANWIQVPTNQCLQVRDDLSVSLTKI